MLVFSGVAFLPKNHKAVLAVCNLRLNIQTVGWWSTQYGRRLVDIVWISITFIQILARSTVHVYEWDKRVLICFWLDYCVLTAYINDVWVTSDQLGLAKLLVVVLLQVFTNYTTSNVFISSNFLSIWNLVLSHFLYFFSTSFYWLKFPHNFVWLEKLLNIRFMGTKALGNLKLCVCARVCVRLL